MKLEVGMYVRTKDGIAKIQKIDNEEKYLCLDKEIAGAYENCDESFTLWIYEGNVLKASHNPIDLIEVGDIVKIQWLDNLKEELIFIYNQFKLDALKSDFRNNLLNIKSIATKEQFSSIEYRLGE